ncbi:MAG: DNA-3-methyladenine glycosylase I [Proteobacteria bacterium]|nr:DNA-3-methyladenine glycosylase I [Pseudomonadota bacterium]NOG59154.1 DNA-3-methyladenine glycosylase I [Pseudomonadota bacterium]
MKSFELIYESAVDRCGGVESVKDVLPIPRTIKELKKLTDAFCLSNMTCRIFQAGLNRKIIDDKWPAFEQVFQQFDIDAVRMMSNEQLEALMDEKRIVRHWGKIQSVRHNAQTIYEFNEEQGGFVKTIAEWPSDNIVALWDVLKKQFKQLGGASGPYFLRRVKKDSFLLTGDVTKALFRWGAIDETPKNKKQLQYVQNCMNEWQAESDRPYCQISMILALSVD